MPNKIDGLLFVADVETNLKMVVFRLNLKVGELAGDGPPIVISHRHVNRAYNFESAESQMAQVTLSELRNQRPGFDLDWFSGRLVSAVPDFKCAQAPHRCVTNPFR
jgi:hypothetical protein